MVSTKIIFRTDKKNSAGEHPLYLRLIKDRKSKYISIGQYLKPEHWDEENKRVRKNHPNSQRLNNYIAQKISEAQGIALELEISDKYVPTRIVKDHILGRTSESFFTFSKRFLIQKETNDAVGTYNNFNNVVSKVRQFSNGHDLMFDDITINWLKNFETYLRTECKNKTNTIHKDLKIIRRIINEAISEEIFPYAKNPFLRYKLKTEETQKNYLTDEELNALEMLQLIPGSPKELSRNLFVFACYAAGLRVSDVLQLRWKNYDDEKITVKTQKTNSMISVKLPSKAIEIINYYKPTKPDENDFIFPALQNDLDFKNKQIVFKAIRKASNLIDNNLKKLTLDAGITKHIHMHCSRHSFAVRALKKGMRIEHVSALMSHKSIKTTQIYAKIVNADLDKAMAVFN